MSKTNQNKGLEFFQELINSLNDNTFVAVIGKIIDYDSGSHLATVQPLELDDDGSKRNSVLQGCEVIKQARQTLEPIDDGKVKVCPLSKGDEVVVLFLDGDIDNYTGGEYKAASNRKHSINDGVVIGNL